MADNLFRREASPEDQHSGLGETLLAGPPSRWLWLCLILLLTTAMGLFLVLGQYTRRETVTGQLVPASGLINITALSPGTVARLHVEDGQSIQADEVLMRSQAIRTRFDLVQPEHQLMSSLRKRRGATGPISFPRILSPGISERRWLLANRSYDDSWTKSANRLHCRLRKLKARRRSWSGSSLWERVDTFRHLRFSGSKRWYVPHAPGRQNCSGRGSNSSNSLLPPRSPWRNFR